MHPSGGNDRPGPEELVDKIQGSLFILYETLVSINKAITFYHYYHAVEHIRRDPPRWDKLDEAYTIYEEQSNHCRRLWMKLQAAAEKRLDPPAGDSSGSGSHPLGRSPSPLEYQSESGEGEQARSKREEYVTPMDIDQVDVERAIPRPPTPPATDPPPKQKHKNASTSRSVIVTPSGPTSSRLAPIPKGAKLSVETTRIPAPQNPYTFNLPRNLTNTDWERTPLNRTKRNHPDAHSSQDSPLQSISQGSGPSTAQTSVRVSPRRKYSSAKDYWESRRQIRTNDFRMDEDRRFNSLDCVGPPFEVNMAEITHNTTPATQCDIRAVYGVTSGLTPSVCSDKLAKHRFDGWMVPNMTYHPFLPARPGWPGLMLRLDDDLEEWGPGEGTEFRVVIKKEPRFIEYVGQYEMVRLGDVTGDEWKKQSVKVKNRWIQVLGGGQSWKEAVARIALRKNLGREPSTPEFTKFTDKITAEGYAKMKHDLKDNIEKAFCSGQEVIAVWGMKCVGYDYKFEKHLARTVKEMKPSSSVSPKKRKAPAKDGEAVSGDEGDKGDDSEPDNPTPSKHQRTAKGKAKRVRYDWSDARFQGDSQDEDYRPVAG